MKKIKDWIRKLKQQQQKSEDTTMATGDPIPTPPPGYTTLPPYYASSTITSAASMASIGPPYTNVGTVIGTSTTVPGYGSSYTFTAPPTFITTTSGYYGGYTMPIPSGDLLTISDGSKEIVRLNRDGTVTWAEDEIKIDEAMQAFAKTLSLSVEMAAGITNAVKSRMRDSVFEDLIAIAKEKGALTAEELTYLLQASKIVEKLRGAKE